MIRTLAREGVLKPPSIRYSGREEQFVFTPKPGAGRLNVSNREIYERAMALISAVRKGQLLPNVYRIKLPLRLLEALLERGRLGASSEADVQYRNLVHMRVGRLKELAPGRWEFHLIRTEENLAALRLAISLLKTGDLADMEVNQEARIALTRDERYVQSILSAAELRRREAAPPNPEAEAEFERLLTAY